MENYDVVVAGGGNAGLCAALSARDAGARVLLVERSPAWRRGGNSRHTRDIRYAHAEADEWASTPYPVTEFIADLEEIAQPHRADLAELMVIESQTLPHWMEERGIHWQAQIRGTLHLNTNRFFLGGGKALINAYYETAIRRGVEVLYATSVAALDVAEGHCDAVHLTQNGSRELVGTRSLIVSSGGLEANASWLAEWWGEAAKNFIIRGTPDNDGTLVLALLAQGAEAAGNELFHAVGVDARSPRFDGGIVTRVDSIPFSVVLNKNGVRFYDEGEDAWPKRYAQWGQLIARQPEQLVYSIFDSQSLDLFVPPLYPPLTANSLKGLLSQVEIDTEEAIATIQAFNAAVDERHTFDPTSPDGRSAPGIEPPRTNWARAIDRSPFFLYPLRPGLTFTYAGLAIDEKARVLRSTGTAYENIFAAGEAMAGNILTSGYLAGVGLTIGSVFGRIAGQTAAEVANAY